ncbi:MAG: cellulase family glycosylhydrolase, partial [Phycisphaeraceae bacterium]|nr:cellulase family glycosylhydrolase [Phycisphaeraceae bacterium]
MGIEKHCVAAIIVMALSASGHGMEAPPPRPGLSVQNGGVTLEGRPYCGMGANYFSLFSRTLQDSSDRSYEIGLKQLSEARIPFVRFMACAFWPAEWDLYLQDKATYFARLDRVVRCAEKHKIGLIPSLFWHMATVPDLMGEPMDQYGDPESRTVAFVRQYTREVVLRYRASPAIWGWEFGNEYNLAVDLPNASEHRPPVVPSLKTARHRTARDELSSSAMLCAYAEFAKTVRQYDTHRILITGNAVPRPSAYHNTLEKSWKRDSDAQFETILLRDNPSPFDTLSVHVYAKAKPDYAGSAQTLADWVNTMQVVSTKAQKPLFIGEFGAPRTLGRDAERAGLLALIKAIETNRVPLSAFWVFDYPGQNKDWNVTWDNDRQYMLSLVSE